MNAINSDMQEAYMALRPGEWYELGEVSEILHMSPRQVERALIALQDRGVVEIDSEGRYRRLVKAHIRHEGERLPCPSGRRWNREHKHQKEQAGNVCNQVADSDAAAGGGSDD